MTSGFLLRYAQAVVSALRARGLIEVREGRAEAVARDLAEYLASRAEGHQAIDSTARGLVESPDVIELFADDDELKDVVDGLERF